MEKAKNQVSKFSFMLSNHKKMLESMEENYLKAHLKNSFDTHFCDEWESVADYINHPAADLLLIAEFYHHAPQFVEAQPAWTEIEKHPEWATMLARDLRRLPVSYYRIPAYYLESLLAGKDGKKIANCLAHGSIDLEKNVSRLIEKNNQSIDVVLATIEKRPEWLLHFAKSKYANVRLRVARNEFSTADVLRLLAQDTDHKIVQTTLQHKNFSGDVVEEFSERTSSDIVSKVDRLNTATWGELCDFFTMPELPEEILDTLATRDEAVIVFACAQHPSAPERIWRKALEHPEAWVKAAAALNPNIPEQVLRELAASDDFDIAFALASNPGLPEDLQLQLARHPERTLRHHIADQHLSTAIWETVASNFTPFDIRGPLEHWLSQALAPDTSSKVLKTFFWPSNKDYSCSEVLSTSVMHAVALHPNFPEERLAEYRYYLPWIETKNRIIQLMVLENRKLPRARPTEDWRLATGKIGDLPAYIANHVAQYGDFNLKRNSLYHPKLNRSHIIPMVFLQDVPTLKKLAERTEMPRFFYELLWAHGYESVRKILKNNTYTQFRKASFTLEGSQPTQSAKTTSEVQNRYTSVIKIKGNREQRLLMAENTIDSYEIKALARDKSEEVRAMIATRPEVFRWPEFWTALANDCSRKVRSSVARNPRTPWEAFEKLANDIEPEVIQSAIYGLRNFSAETTRELELKLSNSTREIASLLARYARENEVLQKLSTQFPSDVMCNDSFIPSIEFAQKNRNTYPELGRLLNGDEQSETEIACNELIAITFNFLLNFPDAEYKKYALAHPNTSRVKIEFYETSTANLIDQHNGLCDNKADTLKELLNAFKTASASTQKGTKQERNVFFAEETKAIPSAIKDHILRYAQKSPDELIHHYIEKNRQMKGDDPFGSMIVTQDITTTHGNLEAITDLLSTNKLVGSRCIAALHSRNSQTQQNLMQDPSLKVIEALASNPHCNPDVLTSLSSHEKIHIRAAIAYNMATPLSVQTTLRNDTSSWVREGANCQLARQSDDIEIQKDLIINGEFYIFERLSLNPNCHPTIIAILADSDNEEIRLNLTRNQNCSEETLRKLAQDPLRRIRVSAENHLKRLDYKQVD